MARVVVTPETFSLVDFDAGRIAELVAEVADRVGLPADAEVRVEVDERVPLGRSQLTSLEPVTIAVQGGAFENAKVPRTLSDRSVVDVVGRLLFRAADRLDPAFADAPVDDELTLQQHTAWDAYAVGRCQRAGYFPQKARRLYHFRNRHGFTDTADRVFERLWSAERLTWADLDAACAETTAARYAKS
ncbi:MAG TPA: hypothetical protein VM938_09715 [Acidimicrobiales bacterium]|nr:hypothetical protein [Acidimicrobiales bacterium]